MAEPKYITNLFVEAYRQYYLNVWARMKSKLEVSGIIWPVESIEALNRLIQSVDWVPINPYCIGPLWNKKI